MVTDSQERWVQCVCDGLAAGELDASQLTARHLGNYLGRTTSVLYHHWGSLDGFLHAVAQAGFVKLSQVLREALSSDGRLPQLAEAFVRFGLDHPVLYHVMFERSYDWDALRALGALPQEMLGLSLWGGLVAFLAGAGSGSEEPSFDARILYAGLHGLVSLANSGRANVGAQETSDREMALAAARKLAERLAPQHVSPRP